jgi:hypothetical protein
MSPNLYSLAWASALEGVSSRGVLFYRVARGGCWARRAVPSPEKRLIDAEANAAAATEQSACCKSVAAGRATNSELRVLWMDGVNERCEESVYVEGVN